MMDQIKVSVVDDHPVVLQGFKTMLSSYNDFLLLGAYADPALLLEDLGSNTPDVLFFDIKMPVITGEELVEILADKYPQIKLIALTYLDSLYYAKLVMRKGASGYLLKTSSADEVRDAIKAVHNGSQYIETSIKDKIFQHALLNKKQNNEGLILTRREREVLQLIASNFNSSEIAGKLYISKRTVENHRANMLLKLKVKNAPSLVKKAIELNLL